MAGLIDVGNNYKSTSLSGMRRLSDLERSREQEEKQLDRQDEADKKANAMSGMAMGAYYGSSFGLWGTIIGAAAGYLGGSLL